MVMSSSDGQTEFKPPTERILTFKATPLSSLVFEKMAFTIEYQAGTGGYIEGAASQNVLYQETAQTVTAVPEKGYMFIGWSDGVTSPSREKKAMFGNLFLLLPCSTDFRRLILMTISIPLHIISRLSLLCISTD